MSVTLYPRAQALLDQAMARVLAEVAFQVEAEAKAVAPVDTGFLQNTIQAILPSQPGAVRRREYRQRRTYVAHATRGARRDEALVVCSAEYAYWVERRTPFLLPAALRVAATVPSIVRRHRVP